MQLFHIFSLIAVFLLLGCSSTEKDILGIPDTTPKNTTLPTLLPGELTEQTPPHEPEVEDARPAVSEPIREPGLLAHWSFDEHANDSTGIYAGMLNGGAAIQSGKIGNAVFFDGIDDYVEFSQNALDAVGSLSQGTISFWFNYESLLDTQTVMPLFYIGNNQGSPDNMYVIEIGHSAGDGRTSSPDPNDKKIYSTWIKNNREPFLCFDSGRNMAENTWHHYAVVVGPSGNQGYINGVLIENTDHNFGDSGSQYFLDSFEGKETFLLGYGRSSFMISPNFVYYKGFIDDLRIYDRPLEWAEVQNLYSLGT
jgi:hypothetical protein